ncbi:AAA-like domain-containing protein [Roseburia hominis]
MRKEFNISGDCKPEIHYMVDITEKLKKIKKMVDEGRYFTINRARQYGKTTTLKALKKFLEDEYLVVRMDFQRLGYASFETEQSFVTSFSTELLECVCNFPADIKSQLCVFIHGSAKSCTLQNMFRVLSRWCRSSEKQIVLMIDEVDSATNNQVFLDFLAQLRSYYLDRDEVSTFQSVILAGVYDVKNIKRKIRLEDEHKTNSPWNIAADFDVVMSFSKEEIAGMLCAYEKDCHTGMNLEEIAGLIYCDHVWVCEESCRDS